MTVNTRLVLGLLLLLVLVPLAACAWSALRHRHASRTATPPRATEILASTLAFTLAYNLVFFTQEVFLVLPKALTPGLEPTLFHNNHTWKGQHPVQELLQGSGALATLVAGLLAWFWLARHAPRGQPARLVLFWFALLGILSALPQVLIGSAVPANDVGRAMQYLGMDDPVKLLTSLLACVAMALACWRLTPWLLPVEPGVSREPRDHAATALRLGVLPCLLAQPLIIPFRIPGHPLEVLLPPVLDGLIAAAWIAAAGWRVRPAPAPPVRTQSARGLWLALAGLLAFFQLVLRQGIVL